MEHRRNGERPAAAGLDSVAVAHDEKAIPRSGGPGLRELRSSDLEPYTGLRYLSKLFRFMAIIMLLLLVAELITGIYTQGAASIPTLLGEASRLIVLAGVLWGTGRLCAPAHRRGTRRPGRPYRDGACAPTADSPSCRMAPVGTSRVIRAAAFG